MKPETMKLLGSTTNKNKYVPLEITEVISVHL